jgi:hypothetical protein
MASDGRLVKKVAAAQGAYFLATGIWPLVSRRTSERVTGPKSDFWLAHTVGVLVGSIGAVLLLADKRERLTPDLHALGIASAAGLGVIDVCFAAAVESPRCTCLGR